MAAARLVGLLDHRVVRCIGIATIGVGVAAVTSGCVAAGRRGVSTLGVSVVVVWLRPSGCRSRRTCSPSAPGARTWRRRCRCLSGCCRCWRLRRHRPWRRRRRRSLPGCPDGRSTRCSASRNRPFEWLLQPHSSCEEWLAIARLVGLLDHRVVRCLGVAAIGIGVSAVTSGRVAAGRRGVSTVGVGVTADRDGNRVAVADLRVAGVGVAAFATGGRSAAAGRARVALGDAAAVASAQRQGTGSGTVAAADAAPIAMATTAAITAMRYLIGNSFRARVCFSPGESRAPGAALVFRSQGT